MCESALSSQLMAFSEYTYPDTTELLTRRAPQAPCGGDVPGLDVPDKPRHIPVVDSRVIAGEQQPDGISVDEAAFIGCDDGLDAVSGAQFR